MSDFPRSLDSDDPLLRAKLQALAEFAAGAGHEINNPLATIIGRAQLLLKNERDATARAALLTIVGQAYHIRDMIGDVMLFGRPPEPRPTVFAAEAAIREAIATSLERSVEKRLVWEFEFAPGLAVRADRTQFAVVIAALAQNAVEAARPGGRISIATRRQGDDVAAGMEFTIQDDGPGLTNLEREHLFDPFYSGRQAGRGLGFGLSKCWRIMQQHGGRIAVETPVDGGVRVIVTWPGSVGERK